MSFATSYNKEFKHFLNNFSTYEFEDALEYKNFEYIYTDQLKTIKNKFDLEKIIDDKNEIKTIINLLKWVNDNLIYNGSNYYPGNRNAIEIVDYIKKEDKGVNCRMLSTVLNEIYLSCGFRSKFITCIPMGLDYYDCHVVVSVFSKSLNKWIFIDPSHGIFVKNINGEIIGLEEFRLAIINNDSININVDNNYKGGEVDYFAYMTKNLFCFSSNLISEFNHESNNIERYVYCLSPKNYLPIGYENFLDQKGGVIKTKYISNPDFFWKETNS